MNTESPEFRVASSDGRVTISDDSEVPAAGELAGILRAAGFIELRRVYEPELQLETLAPDNPPELIPWALYTLADLPFKPGLSSISFAFVPTWRQHDYWS